MSGCRLAVLVSEGSHSRLVVTPGSFVELGGLIEKTMGEVGKQITVYHVKEADGCEELKDEKSFQKAIGDTKTTLTLLIKPRLPSQCPPKTIVTFEGRHKLRIQNLDDGSERVMESSNLNWTGRSCFLTEKKVVFSGGNVSPRAVFLFDLVLFTESRLADMQCSRMWHGLCSLHGSIYAIGGRETATSPPTASSEVYTESMWQILPQMNTPRESVTLVGHLSTVYAFGGFDGRHRLSSIEKLEPARWIVLSFSLPGPRQMLGVVFLREQKVMIAGGQDQKGETGDVYELDLDSGETLPLPSLPSPDFFTGRALFLQPDNKVLAYGRKLYTFTPSPPMWTSAS